MDVRPPLHCDSDVGEYVTGGPRNVMHMRNCDHRDPNTCDKVQEEQTGQNKGNKRGGKKQVRRRKFTQDKQEHKNTHTLGKL